MIEKLVKIAVLRSQTFLSEAIAQFLNCKVFTAPFGLIMMFFSLQETEGYKSLKPTKMDQLRRTRNATDCLPGAATDCLPGAVTHNKC